jgi:hypothetical protein
MFFRHIFRKPYKKVNEVYVFDKAKYHEEAVLNAGLDEDQSFVHTGLFFAWLIEKELFSEFFKTESEELIPKFKSREITPCEIYKFWDGTLIGEMMNVEGYNFSIYYFDLDKGQYLSDYAKVFQVELTSTDTYKIKDTWENYEKIKITIDNVYDNWKKRNHWR